MARMSLGVAGGHIAGRRRGTPRRPLMQWCLAGADVRMAHNLLGRISVEGWEEGEGRERERVRQGQTRSWPLHPTPYTLRPAPSTLHPIPHTLHPTPYTLHPTPASCGRAVGEDVAGGAGDGGGYPSSAWGGVQGAGEARPLM